LICPINASIDTIKEYQSNVLLDLVRSGVESSHFTFRRLWQRYVKSMQTPFPITMEKFRFYITMSDSKAKNFVRDSFYALNYFLRINHLVPLPNHLKQISSVPVTDTCVLDCYQRLVLNNKEVDDITLHKTTCMFLANAGWFRYNDLLYFDLPGTLASRSKGVFYLILLKRKRSAHVCRLPVKLAFHKLSLYIRSISTTYSYAKSTTAKHGVKHHL
jgi:hypothetical protein